MINEESTGNGRDAQAEGSPGRSAASTAQEPLHREVRIPGSFAVDLGALMHPDSFTTMFRRPVAKAGLQGVRLQ